MPINLVKGQNHVLNMNIFHVGLGWDVNEGASPYPFDLDVSAFMIGANKKILNDDFLVYYNSEHRVLPSNLTRSNLFLQVNIHLILILKAAIIRLICIGKRRQDPFHRNFQL